MVSQVCLVCQEEADLWVQEVNLANEAHKVFLVKMVAQVNQVQWVLLEALVYLVLVAHKDLKETRVTLE